MSLSLINEPVGDTCLTFQGIVSKQIKYNLHPAGQRWKWVPEKTKQLYWEQFQDLVNWDITKYDAKDIKAGYEQYLRQHAYSNVLNYIRTKKRPPTVNDFTWAVLEEYKRSKQYRRSSESGKKNRMIGGDRCKQYGGSRAATDMAARELRVTGVAINPLKLSDTYHPTKRKNGEIIHPQSEVQEAVSKLSAAFREHIQNSQSSNNGTEISNASKITSSEWNSKYLEAVGCKRKRVFGTGRYSKAFLLELETSGKGRSSSSRRSHDICLAWDEWLRTWFGSQGEKCPLPMPPFDARLQLEDPDLHLKNFEKTWVSFFKEHGMDPPTFFPSSHCSSQDSQDS
ncbi:unnamed protein product, partial [Cuscuta epithymum]